MIYIGVLYSCRGLWNKESKAEQKCKQKLKKKKWNEVGDAVIAGWWILHGRKSNYFDFIEQIGIGSPWKGKGVFSIILRAK